MRTLILICSLLLALTVHGQNRRQLLSLRNAQISGSGGGGGTTSGPVLLDAVSVVTSANAITGAVSVLNYQFTNTLAGVSSPYLLVCTALDISTTNDITVTYNGVTVPQLTNVYANNNTTGGRLFINGLTNPATGANTVTITPVVAVPTGDNRKIMSAAISFSHVVGTTNKSSFGSSTAPAITIATVNSNMTVAWAGAAVDMSAWPTTDRAHLNDIDYSGVGNVGLSTQTNASSVTFTWTAGNDWWGVVGLDLKHD